MAIFSSIAAAVTAVTGVVGTAVSAIGAMQQAKGAKQAEALRMRQMNLESARNRRSNYRQMIIARSQALTNATSQGAGESSGLSGGQAGTTQQAASNLQGINQGQSIGYQMFQANSKIANGQMLQGIGGGIQGLGSFFSSNYEAGSRVTQNPW